MPYCEYIFTRPCHFRLKDKVRRNPRTWRDLGRDAEWRDGIGIVVEPAFPLDEFTVCVQWLKGKALERESELEMVPLDWKEPSEI